MSFFGKTYALEENINYEDYLRNVGYSEEKIEAQMNFKPIQKIIQEEGESYTITGTTPTGSRETTFKSGVEFDDTLSLGSRNVPIKSSYTVNGNKVTHVIRSDDGVTSSTMEYNKDELIVTITADKFDGVAKRIFKVNK